MHNFRDIRIQKCRCQCLQIHRFLWDMARPPTPLKAWGNLCAADLMSLQFNPTRQYFLKAAMSTVNNRKSMSCISEEDRMRIFYLAYLKFSHI